MTDSVTCILLRSLHPSVKVRMRATAVFAYSGLLMAYLLMKCLLITFLSLFPLLLLTSFQLFSFPSCSSIHFKSHREYHTARSAVVTPQPLIHSFWTSLASSGGLVTFSRESRSNRMMINIRSKMGEMNGEGNEVSTPSTPPPTTFINIPMKEKPFPCPRAEEFGCDKIFASKK